MCKILSVPWALKVEGTNEQQRFSCEDERLSSKTRPPQQHGPLHLLPLNPWVIRRLPEPVQSQGFPT